MREVKLSDLQAAIMQVLWKKNEATASAVQEVLNGERELAKTTVSTVLSRLEDKGIVGHRTEGRAFVYFPAVSQEEVRRSMVGFRYQWNRIVRDRGAFISARPRPAGRAGSAALRVPVIHPG